MWPEFVLSLDSSVLLWEPTDDTAIAAAEAALGVAFPDELAALLRETNGVSTVDGPEVVWSCERIVSENQTVRADQDLAARYMPFDHLLLFGEQGTGNLFAYGIQQGVVRRPDIIYIWGHETDSRTAWAFSLGQYLLQQLEVSDDDEYDEEEEEGREAAVEA